MGISVREFSSAHVITTYFINLITTNDVWVNLMIPLWIYRRVMSYSNS